MFASTWGTSEIAKFKKYPSTVGSECLHLSRCGLRCCMDTGVWRYREVTTELIHTFLFAECRKKKNKMETSAKKKMQFLDLYCMVMADGIVHPKEMETLYRIGLENYGLSEADINEGVKSAGVSSVIPELLEERIAVLYEMAIIAWADGVLEDSERNMLCRYAAMYGVNEDSIDELVNFLLDKAKSNADEKDVINELNK